MKTSQEQNVALKLKIFETQQHSKYDNSSHQHIVNWIISSGLRISPPLICRRDIMNAIHKKIEIEGNADVYGDSDSIVSLLKNCQELYDLAFLIKKYQQVTNKRQIDRQDILRCVYQKFNQLFQNEKNITNHLHIQNLVLYISIKQAYPKQDLIVFSTYLQNSYAIQCAEIYQYIMKPLFEKKNLEKSYSYLVGLVYWFIMINQPVILFDLGKKINNFLLYDKSENSIRMINVCNVIFDILTIKFQRDMELNHMNLAGLLVRFQAIKFNAFFQIWLESRLKVIDTLDFENMLKVLTKMGASGIVLNLLDSIWKCMKKLKKFNILLGIFTNYLRQEFLTMSLKDSQQLINYLKILRAFMIGLCNRQRFQGEQIDTLTNNICMHSLKRSISLNLSYRFIIEIYSIYENRFSSLSEKSKRFFYEIQVLSKMKLQVVQIINLCNEYMIRQVNVDDELDNTYKFLNNRRASKRYRGLQNLFNTCYINSLLQALFMTKKFKNQIMQISEKANIPSKKTMFYSLAFLFEELNKKSMEELEALRPDYFKLELPRPFNTTTQQQDVAEFFRIYLDAISKQLQGQGQSYEKIQRLLIQKLKKTIICLQCKSSKTQEESLFDVILRFQKEEDTLYISRLIQQNFISEQFVGENQIQCLKCNKKTNSISQAIPYKLSDIMIFTLSLFQYVGEGKKMLNTLRFQFTLNLGVLMNNHELGEYQLYAFIVHIGTIASAGHYVTYARNLQQNPTTWFHFNDTLVQEIDISKPEQFNFGSNETPYMLFYSKKKSGVNASRLKP